MINHRQLLFLGACFPPVKTTLGNFSVEAERASNYKCLKCYQQTLAAARTPHLRKGWDSLREDPSGARLAASIPQAAAEHWPAVAGSPRACLVAAMGNTGRGDSSFNTFVLLGTDFRKKQVLWHSRLEGSSGAHLVHPSSQRRANFEVRAGFSGFLSVEH